jgi:hypothetical protein
VASDAVEKFVEEHRDELPALVKREVRNELTMGAKNPRRKQVKTNIGLSGRIRS